MEKKGEIWKMNEYEVKILKSLESN